MGSDRLGEKFCLALVNTVWEIHMANPSGGVMEHLAGVLDDSPDFVRDGSRRWVLVGSDQVVEITDNGFYADRRHSASSSPSGSYRRRKRLTFDQFF